MDVLSGIFQVLGDAVNGVLQVIADFINLIIEILPNPDPFPEMIGDMSVSTTAEIGFSHYWLDAFVGVDFSAGVLIAWATLMVASSVFAVVYWVIKAIKP